MFFLSTIEIFYIVQETTPENEDEFDEFMRNASCSEVIVPSADEVEKYTHEVEHQKFRRKTRFEISEEIISLINVSKFYNLVKLVSKYFVTNKKNIICIRFGIFVIHLSFKF